MKGITSTSNAFFLVEKDQPRGISARDQCEEFRPHPNVPFPTGFLFANGTIISRHSLGSVANPESCPPKRGFNSMTSFTPSLSGDCTANTVDAVPVSGTNHIEELLEEESVPCPDFKRPGPRNEFPIIKEGIA